MKKNKLIADWICRIHGLWAAIMVFGTPFCFYFPTYRFFHTAMIAGMMLVLLRTRGKCPVNNWENHFRAKYAPHEVYTEPFIPHYVEKYTGVRVPDGLVNFIIFCLGVATLVSWL